MTIPRRQGSASDPIQAAASPSSLTTVSLVSNAAIPSARSPRWSAEAAREEAKKLRKAIDRGVDPAGFKRTRRTAPTIQDLIDRYIADHLPTKTLAPVR